MWSHTDRAPSSQISRSTAHGAHKRPGHNWKCQNQYCWQALIKLNMFPSGEEQGREGREREGGLARGAPMSSLSGISGFRGIAGDSYRCDTTLATPSVQPQSGQSNKIAHHPSNFLRFNCEAKLKRVLARNGRNLLLLTLMQCYQRLQI